MNDERRMFAAMLLARDITAVEGLILGHPVPRHLLDPDVLARIGEPIDGPDMVLDDDLALAVELHRQPATAPDEAERVFMDAYEFVEMQIDPPEVLWGDRETCIIPAGGLVLCAGRPGVGKTTWVIDLACHLASGIAYPAPDGDQGPEAYPVARPLRIALIENEGPLELFRDKLKAKLERWPHRPTDGWLGVQTWRWGAFSFADPDAYRLAAAELDALAIDLVIGDPLAMLGPGGVGSPEDTRTFVNLIRGLGLGRNRAFLFLHHFRERVEKNEDELQRLSGSWGGHLDTLLTLQPMGREEELRLAWPKIRWGRGRAPEPVILGRVYATQSYSALRRESDQAVLEPLLVEALAAGREAGEGYGGAGWRTYTQLAQVVADGKRKTDTKAALEGAPHLFVSVTGAQARDLGARAAAVLWGLAEWDEGPQTMLEEPFPF